MVGQTMKTSWTIFCWNNGINGHMRGISMWICLKVSWCCSSYLVWKYCSTSKFVYLKATPLISSGFYDGYQWVSTLGSVFLVVIEREQQSTTDRVLTKYGRSVRTNLKMVGERTRGSIMKMFNPSLCNRSIHPQTKRTRKAKWPHHPEN